MDESEIYEINGGDGNHGLFHDIGEFSNFDCNDNVKSARFVDDLKFSILKLIGDGAGKVLMTRKLPETTTLSNGIMRQSSFRDSVRGFPSEIGNCRVCGEKNSQESTNINCTLKEIEKVHARSDDYPLLQSSSDQFGNTSKWNNEYVDVSEVVNSPSGGLSEFPFNFLAFLAVLVIKSIAFQISLLLSFITFPIWLSYFSFMFLMFPFQTLRHIRGYLMKKLLRMWGASCMSVTSFICARVNAQKSVVTLALRFSSAFFWSMYLCFLLFGLFVSGFVIGGLMMRRLVEEPIQTTETLNFDYTKTNPIAFVPIMSSNGVGVSSGLISKDNVEVGKQVDERVIPYNHKLHLTVSLTLPESEYNMKLGVFQVRVEFLTAHGKVTATSSYPCMLRFKSQPIRFAETFLKSAPLIAGFQSESQILNIKMSEFIEGYEPTACLKVILEQRAEYQPGAGIPEIYAASLALESELPQFKRIIWYWRRTIFIWISIMSFVTELVFILVFCRPIIIPRGRPRIDRAKKDSKNTISWFKSS